MCLENGGKRGKRCSSSVAVFAHYPSGHVGCLSFPGQILSASTSPKFNGDAVGRGNTSACCLPGEAAAGFLPSLPGRLWTRGWLLVLKKKKKKSPFLLLGVSVGYSSVSAHLFPFCASHRRDAQGARKLCREKQTHAPACHRALAVLRCGSPVPRMHYSSNQRRDRRAECLTAACDPQV